LPDAAAGAAVDRFLQSVRRRQARAVALESVLLGSATLGIGVVLAGLLARTWPRGVRWVLAAAVLLAVGLVAERIWRHWTRVAGNPFRTARLVAARVPGVSLDLLAALELRRALAHDPSFSTELALAHLRSVDARTAQLDAQAVVDQAAIRRAGFAAIGALAALALVWAAWPDRMRAVLLALRPAAASGGQSAASPSPVRWRCSTSTRPTPGWRPGPSAAPATSPDRRARWSSSGLARTAPSPRLSSS
jgi:hypothetical protein